MNGDKFTVRVKETCMNEGCAALATRPYLAAALTLCRAPRRELNEIAVRVWLAWGRLAARVRHVFKTRKGIESLPGCRSRRGAGGWGRSGPGSWTWGGAWGGARSRRWGGACGRGWGWAMSRRWGGACGGGRGEFWEFWIRPRCRGRLTIDIG